MIRRGLPLAAALWAGAACAGFDAATVCSGTLAFYNSDGTFESYALRLEVDADRYTIRATNTDRGNTTEDRGVCGTYLDAGCRHILPGEDGQPVDHYDFRLEPRGDGRYLYVETWADGFSGQTEVTCRPAPETHQGMD
jgi:hypothetical protein